MNKVILVGRLARDPELRTTSTGKSVCFLRHRGGSPVQAGRTAHGGFLQCDCLGKTSRNHQPISGKGREIAITGRLQNNSFVGRDGTKRYSTDVILDEFDFIGGRGNSGGGGGGYAGGSQGGGNSNNMPLDDVMDDEFHLMADDEDVPF